MPAHPVRGKLRTSALASRTSFDHRNSLSTRATMTTARKFASLTLIAVLSTGCGVGALDLPGVYKIGIPQGNIITQDMVDQLRPGMTKRQVIFVMGTPLIRDAFHQDRWDYIYSYQPGGGTRGQEGVSVFFENDQLVRITGDFVPSAAEEAGNEQAATQ